ncbi:hypothetical protein ER308_07270 [Egibacter rhizosphaerae]|uniref:Uncharacterized protein n=1 Tax=Egibacter rhizosphaerae TaxID=1670831 RepID=A0A411YDS3_9ACTN|nr:hypothetical protein [Egibacter rhizosphaerae]QBI19365.1 hypothetical protein ER308_07270 [Egibacter rhizosphaerae]
MRYVSKPQEVEAIQWRGDNPEEVASFLGGMAYFDVSAPVGGPDDGQHELTIDAGKDGAQGPVPVPVGHWVVRKPGDVTHLWPVDPDHFAHKYEPADQGSSDE